LYKLFLFFGVELSPNCDRSIGHVVQVHFLGFTISRYLDLFFVSFGLFLRFFSFFRCSQLIHVGLARCMALFYVSGLWNHEPAKIRNLGPAKLWVQIPEIRESRRGSSEIRKKPSQRRYLEKSEFDVWTSGRLVNVWNQPRKSRDVKDIFVRVHTRYIP
jgi:hypothetical protein